MKAVFLDLKSLEDLSVDAIRDECGQLQTFMTTEPDQLQARIRDAEVVLVNKVKMDRTVLESAKQLKLICIVATGTNNVDLDAAKELDVAVVHCRGYGTQSVVQHVFALILALQTNLLNYHHAVQRGAWQASRQFCMLNFPIQELTGKTLGIIGYGTLGRAVGRMAKAFGMRLLLAEHRGRSARDGRVDFEQVLAESDVLTLHCPLTEDTRNLIDENALQSMKPTAILINAARGGIVDEYALARALKSHSIAGAGVDVLSEEPPARGNPLLSPGIPNLIITPHCAWGSREARQTILTQTLQNIQSFKRGEQLRRVV